MVFNWVRPGTYLNIEPKHLHDYAVETAFREAHRRVASGQAADRALHFALSVGHSHLWRGFTLGNHRKHEILATGNAPFPASGPDKEFKTGPVRARQLPW